MDDQPLYFGDDHPSSKLHGKQLTITDKGIKLPDGSDGVFTAMEALGLRLNGTQLVVLSCL